MDATQHGQPRATAVITLRLGPRDRALLQALLEREARAPGRRGEEASMSSVIRDLIRRAAKARGVEYDIPTLPPIVRRAPRACDASHDTARSMLLKRLAKGPRGLAASFARHLEVDPAQLSRFKHGREAFPAAKIEMLLAMLTALARLYAQ